jgi:hypothetical protein
MVRASENRRRVCKSTQSAVPESLGRVLRQPPATSASPTSSSKCLLIAPVRTERCRNNGTQSRPNAADVFTTPIELDETSSRAP